MHKYKDKVKKRLKGHICVHSRDAGTRMPFAEVLYRLLLCVYATVAFSIVASNLAAYPHAQCREG